MISHNYLLQNQYTYMYQRHLLFYYFFAKRHSSQVSAIQNAIYIYIYGAKHSLIALNIENIWLPRLFWKCLSSTHVMIFLSILNFHRRINIFYVG